MTKYFAGNNNFNISMNSCYGYARNFKRYCAQNKQILKYPYK